MTANTSPIFTIVPNVPVGGGVLGPTANTNLDGTSSSTSATLIFTAGSFGSYVNFVRCKPVGSPLATVIRIFYCTDTGAFTAGTTNTATNSALLTEIAVPNITLSQTANQIDISIPLAVPIPASTKLFITFGTSTGSSGTGYAVTTFGGDY